MLHTKFINGGIGVCLVGAGHVTADEMLQAKLALAEQAESVKGLCFAIVDFQEVTLLTLTAEDLHRFVEIDMRMVPLVPNLAVAVVAPKEHMFGLARMWEVFAERTGWKTGVFRCSAKACTWVAELCSSVYSRRN
jgi:hypothetical protein